MQNAMSYAVCLTYFMQYARYTILYTVYWRLWSKAQLMEHMRRRGATVRFRPHEFEGGLRGAAADAEIPPGGLLAELPLSEVAYHSGTCTCAGTFTRTCGYSTEIIR